MDATARADVETADEAHRVKDPVCGMTVDPDTAIRRTHDGETYFFCSEHCAESFAADPERYVHGVPAGHHHGGSN